MATLNITIKTNSADAGTYATASQPHKCLTNVWSLIKAITAGTRSASSVDVSVSSADPVAASATATCASVANADTITVAGTVLTAKTSPSGSAEWARGVSNTADAAALAACINAHATVSKYVTASSSAAVVTITANVKGVIGNLITLVSSDGATLAVTGSGKLASGAGGVVGTQVTYGR
jgi:phage tail sheath gpL-like